jgi:hypothetical protein
MGRIWPIFPIATRPPNHRAHRNFHDFVRTGSASHFLPFAVGTVFRFDNRLIKKTG